MSDENTKLDGTISTSEEGVIYEPLMPVHIEHPSPEKILSDLLLDNGSVSIRKLKSKLREYNHNEVDTIVEALSQAEDKWCKTGRSFFTLERAKTIEDSNSEENECSQDTEETENEKIDQLERRRRPSPEKRLCEQYILPYLSSIYYSSYNHDDHEVAFCVQDLRPSEQFRNVDLIAINWRSDENVELVTVEAKMEFNAQVVQQAANYSRFSHRVWIAVVVESSIEVETMIPSLREQDPLLFEYILALGLGVIACQRKQGNGFECYAVQWPRKQNPDEFEKQHFLDCYRGTFEKAGVLTSTKKVAKVS